MDTPMDSIARTAERIIAWLILTVPLAMGRRYFRGCRISLSLSCMSLTMYMEDDIKEKEIKANVTTKS